MRKSIRLLGLLAFCSMLAIGCISVTQDVKKATPDEVDDHNDYIIDTNEELSWFEKFIKKNNLDKIFIGVCLLGIVVGVEYIFIKFKKKNKRYDLIEQIKENFDRDDESQGWIVEMKKFMYILMIF